MPGIWLNTCLKNAWMVYSSPFRHILNMYSAKWLDFSPARAWSILQTFTKSWIVTYSLLTHVARAFWFLLVDSQEKYISKSSLGLLIFEVEGETQFANDWKFCAEIFAAGVRDDFRSKSSEREGNHIGAGNSERIYEQFRIKICHILSLSRWGTIWERNPKMLSDKLLVLLIRVCLKWIYIKRFLKRIWVQV